jgi:hypothetical protein
MSIFTKKVTTPRPKVTPAPQKPPRLNFTTVLIPLNIKNKNGRIYTKENLETHVQDFIDRKNNLGVIYGEFGHPDTADTSLSRVSHIIKNIWFEGNKLMGEIELLNTYYGKEAKSYIDDGITLVARPRSAGTVDEQGYVHLEKLFTFDLIEQQNDAFYGIKELRKVKLKKLEDIISNSSSNEKTDLPTFKESFFFLKK